MATKEFIAYKGAVFTVEWYFDERGRSPALDYFLTLSEDRRIRVMHLFKRIGDFGKISDITKFRSEGDKIFAFKPQPDRFLSFFVAGKKIVISNAFEKKSQKLPSKEKERALQSKNDYESRTSKGIYYL